MAWELSITSAPRGLKPGSAGFCPVSHTQGMPPHLIERLEAISGYRHLEIGSDAGERNPVAWSHTILRLSGETFYVLSRICDAGRDYSGRSNRFAYHLVLKPHELVPAGPAALLQVPGLMRESWDGQVCLIPTEKTIPKPTAKPRRCDSWRLVLGDAGWAGILAQKFLADSQKTVYFIYPMRVDILTLFDEVIALLPESHRWKVTFSTFDQGLGEAVTCRWRAIPEHAPEVSELVKKKGLELWDLRVKRGTASSVPEAVAAREGRLLELPAPRKVAAPVRDATVTQPATPPAVAPSRTNQETPYLELAESTDTPPPLWCASSQGTIPRKKRRPQRLVVIMSVVMLLLGLIIGLGTGFVLWSGVLMPPFLPGIVERIKTTPLEDGNQKVPRAPDSKIPAHQQGEDRTAKETESAEKTPPKNEAPGNREERPDQDTSAKPMEEKPAKSDQPKSEPPARSKGPRDDVSPKEDKSNVVSQNTNGAADGPHPQDAEMGKAEAVALPLSELPIAQVVEIVPSSEQMNLPGGVTLLSWKPDPLWRLDDWKGKKDFAILKVVDHNGQSRYYVRWPEPGPFGKTERIQTGLTREFKIPPIQGVHLELRCVRGWRKEESGNRYVFRDGEDDRIGLKMQQASGKITVSTESLDQDRDAPSVNAIAEIGFYITEETGPKIWVPMVKLEIDTKRGERSQPGKRPQDGGIR